MMVETASTKFPNLKISELRNQAWNLGLPFEGAVILVDICTQRLYAFIPNQNPLSFSVSTSLFGLGAQFDSYKTPPGWHRIAERIGDGEPPGRLFLSRRPMLKVFSPEQWRDDNFGDVVLTRILWLEGLERDVNRGNDLDSYYRYIYIHGTAQEHLLGQPASYGCIRMANQDVIELFDFCKDVPTYVWIGDTAII